MRLSSLKAAHAVMDGATYRKSGSGFRLRPILQCFHIREAVGLFRIMTTYDFRCVVEDHDAVKLHFNQGGHDLGHIVISVVHEGLDEVRQRRADIAEMDLPDLLRAEITDHLRRVFMHERRAAFVPASATQTDADAVFFSDWRNLLDEVGVVLPDLFFRKHAAVGERLIELLISPNAHLIGAGHIKFSGGGAADGGSAAAPNAVAHVSIGGVVDAGLAQVANVLLVFLDLLIAAGQIEGDLRHVVYV